MDAHMRTIDTPDLPVPAMGIDTGTVVANYPPADLSTPVQHGPNIFVLVTDGRWRDQFHNKALGIMPKVLGMLGNVRH